MGLVGLVIRKALEEEIRRRVLLKIEEKASKYVRVFSTEQLVRVSKRQ